MADMSVSSTTNDSSLTSLVAGNQILGKDDFLTLLVAQMKYQDPLDPMDNTQFVSQLAEFSSLEQLQNVDEGIQGLTTMMVSVNSSLAMNAIGKDVKFYGDTVRLHDEGSSDIYYDLSDAATTVKVDIYDENDNLVATLTKRNVSSGSQSIEWNGEDNDGNRLEAGSYSYEITATDSDGNDVSATTYAVDRVLGLKFENGNAKLILDDSSIYLSEILEILGV